MACRVFSSSFRGGHRRYLSIRNHDNRSYADWIRLCPWVIEELRKREQLFKASQGCPSWLKQWEERVSIETETINRNMDSITEKLTALQRKIDGDQNGQWEQPWNWNAVTRPKTKQAQSYLFRLPLPALALVGSCWEINPEKHRRETLSAFLPHSSDTCWLHIHTHTHTDYKLLHIQTVPQNPRSPRLRRFEPPAWQAGLGPALNSAAGPGWLFARAGLLPLLQSRVSMFVIMCFFVAEVFFSCSHTVLWLYIVIEHSLGVVFFSPLSPYVCCIFLQIPCLPVLSTPLSYCMYVWTGWWLISLVLVTSDNKGLLLLLLIFLKSSVSLQCLLLLWFNVEQLRWALHTNHTLHIDFSAKVCTELANKHLRPWKTWKYAFAAG